jgi:hypothetical protein
LPVSSAAAAVSRDIVRRPLPERMQLLPISFIIMNFYVYKPEPPPESNKKFQRHQKPQADRFATGWLRFPPTNYHQLQPGRSHSWQKKTVFRLFCGVRLPERPSRRELLEILHRKNKALTGENTIV